MSGEDFRILRRAISQTAENIISSINADRNPPDRYEDSDEIDELIDLSRAELINRIRFALRRTLGTLPSQFDNQINIDIDPNLLEPVINEARNHGELFVAMVNGPFMLVLKADNPRAFIGYATEYPRHKVTIHWDRKIDDGQTWLVNPADGSLAYSLSFKLPEILKSWVFETSEDARKRAFQVKQEFLSVITIYRSVEEKDQLFKLEFDAKNTRIQLDEINR